jgi:hypothetical protein
MYECGEDAPTSRTRVKAQQQMIRFSDAYCDGWAAQRVKAESSENPYSERTQYTSHMRWLSGWSARFGVIKHGENLAERDKEIEMSAFDE